MNACTIPLAGRENVDGRGIFQQKYLKGCIVCTNCTKPRCVFSEVKTVRNWKLLVQLISEDIQFVCGGELILDEASQYFGKVKTNPAMTCHKVIESTFFKSLKFDAVCVT